MFGLFPRDHFGQHCREYHRICVVMNTCGLLFLLGTRLGIQMFHLVNTSTFLFC